MIPQLKYPVTCKIIHLENKCLEVSDKKLAQVCMMSPTSSASAVSDRQLRQERDYNPRDLEAFNTVKTAISNESGELYFIAAPGGTRKT